MKPKFYLNLFTAMFILTGINAHGQTSDDPVVDKIVNGLDKWLIDHQPEKVYLQTDKPYYAAGDDIWFKAYVTVGNDHRLSALSGALNVELIDSHDSVKRWIKLPMNNGTTWGDLALPDTLPAGNYRLRAYTNWMRNAGPAYYFYKVLTIGTTRSAIAQNNHLLTIGREQGKATKISNTNIDLQFFPEGGYLVNGLTSKVAFKAIDKNGQDVMVKGEIADNENNKIAEFATQHFGMGAFNITPEKGKIYKAIVTYADGSVADINLPPALNSGYVLSINNADEDNIRVKVTTSNDMTNAGQVYIFAQCGGETRYVVKSKTSGSTFGATISKSKFPSGIVQFTLFSAAGKPLNERIAFIKHDEDLLSLNVKADKAVSSTRGKVSISLDAQNDSDKAVIGSFSASVIDESKVQTDEDAESTILSQLLLTSDLRGYIEQPNYYFTTDNDTTAENLDILMLTQGYRRFEWKPLLAGTLVPAVYQPEKLIKISGNVKTLLGNKPVPKAKLILLTPGAQTPFMLDTVADDKGNFAFPGLFLKDSINFIIQARTPKNGKNVTVTLDDNGNEDRSIKSRYFMLPAFDLNEELTNYLAANKKLYDEEAKYGLGNHTRVLQEVKIVAKPKTTIDFSNNLNGPGKADQVITGAVLEQRTAGCAFLNDCLQGLLVGVIFIDGKAYLSSTIPRRIDRAMEIILDGVQVYDFNTIPPEEVGTIEVLKWPQYTAIYGQKGSYGVLVITTKRGTEATNYKQVPVGSAFYSPKGYYRVRTFYSPQYDDPKTNRSIADLRSTIFWKPNIVTDKAGHASFEYYNAGEKGTYRITIEGIDIDGNLGRKVYRYKVE